jgi:hypothetical protein
MSIRSKEIVELLLNLPRETMLYMLEQSQTLIAYFEQIRRNKNLKGRLLLFPRKSRGPLTDEKP